MSAVLAQSVEEARTARRGRVLLRGELVWSQGAFSTDCVIRDISSGGARIRLSAPQPLPNRVFLIDVREPIAHEALVAWKNMPDVGLRFVLEHRIDETCSPTVAYLRRLWIERRNR